MEFLEALNILYGQDIDAELVFSVLTFNKLLAPFVLSVCNRKCRQSSISMCSMIPINIALLCLQNHVV